MYGFYIGLDESIALLNIIQHFDRYLQFRPIFICGLINACTKLNKYGNQERKYIHLPAVFHAIDVSPYQLVSQETRNIYLKYIVYMYIHVVRCFKTGHLVCEFRFIFLFHNVHQLVYVCFVFSAIGMAHRHTK